VRRTWRRPTLPGSYPPSTIGADGLNFRVRDETGCSPAASDTKRRPTCTIARRSKRAHESEDEAKCAHTCALEQSTCVHETWFKRKSPRPLVRVSSRVATFTPPAYQARRLRAVLLVYTMRHLILSRASYLDAFSSYHSRRWLPSDAVGTTTRTPALRPARSSRTRASRSQVPCAHSG
jgi:hypothetical protein